MAMGMGKEVPTYKNICRHVSLGCIPLWETYQAIKNLVCSRIVHSPSVEYGRSVGQGWKVGGVLPPVGFHHVVGSLVQ